MAWNLHTVKQTQLRGRRRVDVGRPKFYFHTGGGQCGLCAVRISDGAFGPRYEWEERHVAEIGADARLACQTTVKGGDAATVTLQAR